MKLYIAYDLDPIYMKDGKFYTSDEGCGCCSNSYYMTPEEMLEKLDDAIKDIKETKLKLKKFIEDRDNAVSHNS